MDHWDGLTPPYGTIVADPPWPVDISYRARPGRNGKAFPATPAHYSTMPVEAICALSVRDLAAENAHLYLWIPPSLNRRGIGVQVAKAWGFRIVSEFVWNKSRLGTGAFPRACHEVLLVARRGVTPFSVPKNIRSVQDWPQGRGHSKKPPAALDLIEQASPAPYVELFCRQPRFGWDSWGWGYEPYSDSRIADPPDPAEQVGA